MPKLGSNYDPRQLKRGPKMTVYYVLCVYKHDFFKNSSALKPSQSNFFYLKFQTFFQKLKPSNRGRFQNLSGKSYFLYFGPLSEAEKYGSRTVKDPKYWNSTLLCCILLISKRSAKSETAWYHPWMRSRGMSQAPNV